MPDISMCKNAECPKRQTCRRFIAKPSRYQSYMGGLAPNKDGYCAMYWPVNPQPESESPDER